MLTFRVVQPYEQSTTCYQQTEIERSENNIYNFNYTLKSCACLKTHFSKFIET